jgi:SAM-dependent methyltransferase
MIRQLLQSRLNSGLRRALLNLRTEYKISRLHNKGKRQARRYDGQTELKLHIGCGPKPKAGWLNIDLVSMADINLDLREPLPFADDSCLMVYSEHFMEHLEHPDETVPFLRESLRVLSSGGRFSVGLPDIEWPIRAYAGDPNYSGWFEYV